MDKLKMHSLNKVDDNIKKIGALFPSCVTERKNAKGEVEYAIDFDMLKQELSSVVVEGKEERYQFTWPDKKKSILAANAPISDTLRPCIEESVDFDNTQNLYIEGDNLAVLKLLQETYLGKIKMIYIDPPYNTGSDFVYDDDFAQNADEYIVGSGQIDTDGMRLVPNLDTNGRFHTDWLNMIYPRIKLAKDLLAIDGVLFISIDDNEVTNLTKICDEVFGARNRIALICHKARASVSNDKIISQSHNTILFYAKDILTIEAKRKMIGLDPVLDGFDLNDNDGRGDYRLVPVDGPGGAKKGNPFYEFLGVEGYWRYSKETMQEKYDQGLIVKRGNNLQQKYFKSSAANTRKTVTTWWDDAGLTSSATAKLKTLMGEPSFDTPKPLELIDRMLRMITFDDDEAIVLDFFSGSATTAHAVMEYNAENKGKRKFIMVQLNEAVNEKSDAYKNGYRSVTEIGKKRIKIAGQKIQDAHRFDCPELDVGFRVLKLDSSNMQEVYYNPVAMTQDLLASTVDNVKADRTPLDLLFQVMLDLGVELSAKIEEYTVSGKTYYTVNGNDIIACFDDNIDNDVIVAIAKQNPLYAVFKDKSFATDSVGINNEQLFKTYSPSTVVKVI